MVSPGGGVGGYSRFQMIGMIKWGQKSKPQKIPRVSQNIPGPKTNPQKIPCQISEPLNFPESIGYNTKIKTERN